MDDYFLFLFSFSFVSFSFLFRYSIIVNIFDETEYTWTHGPSIHPFHLQLSQNHSSLHISPFVSKINAPLSGQMSDEIEYTWWHLAWTIYPDGHSQNQ